MKPVRLDGCTTLGDETAWATFSPCEAYRYLLGRCWDRSLPMVTVTMWNPSKATHEVLDPTVKKVLLIARAEGFGGVIVKNLSAYRSTDPKGLLIPGDPVGPLNMAVLMDHMTEVRVGAWGRIPMPIARRLQVPMFRAESRCTHVFAWTDVAPFVPRHPLFLKNSTRLIPIERTPSP